MTHELRHLSDRELLTALSRCLDAANQTSVDFLVHLGEVDSRELYLAEACSSMFTYCRERLRLAEGSTHRRIASARAGRRFPVIFDMLRTGELHMTAVALLAPLLTPDNHRDILGRARHQTTRAVERLVAELNPRPSLPDLVRRLPAPRATEMAGASPAAGTLAPAGGQDDATVATRAEPAQPTVASDRLAPTPSAPPARARIEPTAADRFRVSFDASEELANKLRRAQDLLGHQLPRGDVAAVFDRALTLLIEDLERTKVGRTKRQPKPDGAAAGVTEVAGRGERGSGQVSAKGSQPRAPSPPSTATAPSRHIPNAIRREVWKRDGGRCTFTSESGQRCTATSRLEFDHLRPFALHGEHAVGDITLRCRGHNLLGAVQAFGAEHMAQYRGRHEAQTERG